MLQGILLSGEFVAIESGRPYPRKDGTTVEPVKLKLLAGSSVFSVEYESEVACSIALGGVAYAKGDQVMVPVFAAGQWDPNTRRRGLVFLQGRRVSRD